MLSKRNIISGIIILILLALMVFSLAQVLKKVYPSQTEDTSESKTLEIDGVKYFPKQDISVFMLLGIDTEGPVKDSLSYNNDGEADMVALVIFDESERTYSILCLNRDTMLKMPTLGVGGKYAGHTYGQLALSHTYGSGLEDSCENTRKTVSEFLYNLEIDHYVSLNMEAVAILNDALGGVTVNVTDDFPVETGITKGEITLKGKQALDFVRTRKNVGDQLNISRMKRHEEYMKGFMSALGEKSDSNDSFFLDLYRELDDFMVTDCSAEALGKYANRYLDYEFDEILSPLGENVVGEKYMEFRVDSKELEKLVVKLFYDKKEI